MDFFATENFVLPTKHSLENDEATISAPWSLAKATVKKVSSKMTLKSVILVLTYAMAIGLCEVPRSNPGPFNQIARFASETVARLPPITKKPITEYSPSEDPGTITDSPRIETNEERDRRLRTNQISSKPELNWKIPPPDIKTGDMFLVINKFQAGTMYAPTSISWLQIDLKIGKLRNDTNETKLSIQKTLHYTNVTNQEVRLRLEHGLDEEQRRQNNAMDTMLQMLPPLGNRVKRQFIDWFSLGVGIENAADIKRLAANEKTLETIESLELNHTDILLARVEEWRRSGISDAELRAVQERFSAYHERSDLLEKIMLDVVSRRFPASLVDEEKTLRHVEDLNVMLGGRNIVPKTTVYQLPVHIQNMGTQENRTHILRIRGQVPYAEHRFQLASLGQCFIVKKEKKRATMLEIKTPEFIAYDETHAVSLTHQELSACPKADGNFFCQKRVFYSLQGDTCAAAVVNQDINRIIKRCDSRPVQFDMLEVGPEQFIANIPQLPTYRCYNSTDKQVIVQPPSSLFTIPRDCTLNLPLLKVARVPGTAVIRDEPTYANKTRILMYIPGAELTELMKKRQKLEDLRDLTEIPKDQRELLDMQLKHMLFNTSDGVTAIKNGIQLMRNDTEFSLQLAEEGLDYLGNKVEDGYEYVTHPFTTIVHWIVTAIIVFVVVIMSCVAWYLFRVADAANPDVHLWGWLPECCHPRSVKQRRIAHGHGPHASIFYRAGDVDEIEMKNLGAQYDNEPRPSGRPRERERSVVPKSAASFPDSSPRASQQPGDLEAGPEVDQPDSYVQMRGKRTSSSQNVRHETISELEEGARYTASLGGVSPPKVTRIDHRPSQEAKQKIEEAVRRSVEEGIKRASLEMQKHFQEEMTSQQRQLHDGRGVRVGWVDGLKRTSHPEAEANPEKEPLVLLGEHAEAP